ncbi:MAG: methylenetetrahydrofolate dehydrogenase [Candidatus Parcubacteria bacterium]|jgi:methylenetetrahydrofolate dehydrogenase (NADP+)/methenyltetrahydrofolate cyclohydrolase
MELSGIPLAEEIIKKLKTKNPPKKFLAIFEVGSDPATISFIKQKEKIAKNTGVAVRIYAIDPASSTATVKSVISRTVRHKTCGGAIVQLPLPPHINTQAVLNSIPPQKDVDVLSQSSIRANNQKNNTILPPSVETVKTILEQQKKDPKNQTIAVVGVGQLIGKPIATWLLGKTKQLIVLDKGSDLSLLRSADVVICGTGSGNIIKENHLSQHALVIDFGYAKDTYGKTVGDFDARELTNQTITYTPTPKGTGPLLVAHIIQNFFLLNEHR